MMLRRLFTRNLGWKLISVILAVLVWTMLRSGVQESLEPGVAHTFSQVPVRVMTTPEDGRTFAVEPESVDVTVRGGADLVQALLETDVETYVDLSSVVATEGLRRRVSVRLPPEARVVRVIPEDVFVDVLNGEPATAGPDRSVR